MIETINVYKLQEAEENYILIYKKCIFAKTINMKIFSIAILLILSFNISFAQEEWDVNNPPGPYVDKTFNFTDGTWMNLDVSPDGEKIVFDLLGDIYIMPSTGINAPGKAKVLRSGLAWEVQPRFSPDGKKILFTSDAGGGDNIWYMDVDGENANQITKEKFRLLNNAIWTPDGQYIIARKHFTSQRSLGAGELWKYHISGGDGIQLTERKNDQQDVNEPSISSDGKSLYFSEDMYPGGFFQYNKDPNDQIFAVRKYDMETAEISTIVGGPGGACRPQVSHDGKKIAFVRRIRTESVLFIYDLETQQQFPVYRNLDKDQQEAWTIFGSYTGFSWDPKDENIYIWAKGKINKVNIESKNSIVIPFNVEAKHKLMETVQFKNEVAPDEFLVKAIRQTSTSSDGKTILFNALGHIYTANSKGKRSQRLTNNEHFEFEPQYSPDNKSIAYVSWDDENMGALNLINIASKSELKLTNKKAIFRTPRFSPDGELIVFRVENGNNHQGYIRELKPGIYTINLATLDLEFICSEGENPRFDKNGKRIFYQTGGYLFGSLNKAYKAFDLESKKTSTLYNSTYANQYVPSPDNKWIAFTELHNVYIAPMSEVGKGIGLSSKTKAFPVAKVSRDAGISLHWSVDSEKLHWTLGNKYFTEDLTDQFMFLEGAADTIQPIDTTGILIELNQKQDKPKGAIAIKNCRIITMDGDKVIENGLLVTKENKITYVGNYSEKLIPANAYIIDGKEKTIMPGIVDVHAHLGAFRYGLSPQKHWEYYTNLAYGVTTTHDPSSNSEMTFSQSEMVKAGVMIGPRIFSTGTILYGADGDFKAEINSLEDAKSALRRTKAFGAFSVKSYNQPRREQRQQVIEAARQLDIQVYPEGGSFFYHNLTMVADGHTGVEHNIPVATLYDDVVKFWSSTKTGNTPTLIVNYGGVNGEYYWYQNTNVWENKKLMSFTPHGIIDSRARHRTMIPDEEYENGHILVSESCKKLSDAGVGINLGSHGQIQGIGAHWELWMIHQGGISEFQALLSATLTGAEYLGMEDEIGSLEVGKLADIIILDGNPLENIRNTENVIYTIANGRLYDAENMNEIGLRSKERTKFHWEMEGSGNAYPYSLQTGSFIQPSCHCHQ